MSVDPRTNAVPNGARSVLRANPDATARLPSPADEFRRADLPDEVARVFRRFREHGVVERAGRAADGAHTYRTDPGAYEVAREVRTDRDTLPCGHGGMRNLRGDAYSCGDPDCDARYDRDTVAAVVFE
ncbi:hypothetical protein [Halobacterium yunchengense]|uniref:hypothetical protein n=1 Tax=Halobacterium yunchengense TaxID=3108497 RepID=UPI00300BCF62